jgi:hypothetical protein
MIRMWPNFLWIVAVPRQRSQPLRSSWSLVRQCLATRHGLASGKQDHRLTLGLSRCRKPKRGTSGRCLPSPGRVRAWRRGPQSWCPPPATSNRTGGVPSYGAPTACTLWHARSCPASSWLLEGHHATALHPGREPRLLPVSATPPLGPHQPAHPVPHVAIQLWQLHGPMSALDIVPPARHHQVAPTDDRGQSRRPSLSAGARVDVPTDRLPGLLAWPPIGEQCARALGAPRLKLAPQDVEPCRSHPHQAGLGRVEWACPLLADQADRV